MIKHFTTKLFGLLAIGLFVSAGIFAQSTVTGAIVGKIADPQGAVVPNASITVTNIGTNKSVTVNATEDGTYRASNLEPGRYRVETTVQGFAPAKADNIVVEVGQATTVDLGLTIGSQVAEVSVTAEAPVINTNSQDFSSNVNQTSISELPINGRRAVNFVLLTPSTVPDGTFGLVSFRGISGVLNNSQVDGGDNNQAWQSEERGRTRIGYVVSQSAIREFQVNTSNYSAEYGRSAGGVINTVTKSGTNEFHGQIFEYYRNNKFGARNPNAFRTILNPDFTTSRVAYKPEDVRHQFGGNVCGPIAKDHLFFCFTYDQQKRNFPGLSVFNNPNYLNTVDRTRLTAVGITTAQVDSTLSFINSLTGPTPRRGDQWIIFPKIDWNINKNNIFTASYNRLRWESPAGLQTQATNNNARHSFGDDFVDVDTLNLRLMSNISANILNEARFQWSKELGRALSQEPLPGEPATATTSQGSRSPSVFLSGGVTFGTTNNFERNAYPDERRTQFADSLTWTHGRHTLKFGGDFSHVFDRISNLRTETGSYSYSNINDFIVDYVRWQNGSTGITACATSPTGAGRVPGRCWTSNYVQGIGIPGIDLAIDEIALFVQDDFRVTPRFTLNMGLRWEYQKLPGVVLPNSSLTVIPFDGRTLNEATSTLPNDKDNFGPRIGFAWDLFGNGKTSLRGGIGIYYGRLMMAQIFNAMINTGNPNGQGQVSLRNQDAGAPSFPTVINPTGFSIPANAAIQFYSKNFQNPTITQYDIVLERQIMKNTVVSFSYLGSLGRHLPTFVNENLMPCSQRLSVTPAPSCSGGSFINYTVQGGPRNGQTFLVEQQVPIISSLGQLSQIQDTVHSRYDAFVAQFNRRFTDGLQVQASWTWAKSEDNLQNSSVFPPSSGNAPYDQFNRFLDIGPSDNDVRHKIVVSAVYSPKFYQGDEGSFMGYVANGWTIAPIVSFYTGKPYSARTTGGSGLNNANGEFRFPFDGRNVYRMPNIFNTDLRISKRFNFTEDLNLELIAEGFNIFNRTHVFDVSATAYQRNITTTVANGTSTGTLVYQNNFGNPSLFDSFYWRERQIQFAARFNF